MIKHFCDFCGDEIVKGFDGKHVVSYEDKELLISVAIATGEEICTACIAAALNPTPEDYEIIIEDPTNKTTSIVPSLNPTTDPEVTVPPITVTADSPLEALGLSKRTLNALARGGYTTVRDVLLHTEYEIRMQVAGLGDLGMHELITKLDAHGLSL